MYRVYHIHVLGKDNIIFSIVYSCNSVFIYFGRNYVERNSQKYLLFFQKERRAVVLEHENRLIEVVNIFYPQAPEVFNNSHDIHFWLGEKTRRFLIVRHPFHRLVSAYR